MRRAIITISTQTAQSITYDPNDFIRCVRTQGYEVYNVEVERTTDMNPRARKQKQRAIELALEQLSKEYNLMPDVLTKIAERVVNAEHGPEPEEVNTRKPPGYVRNGPALTEPAQIGDLVTGRPELYPEHAKVLKLPKITSSPDTLVRYSVLWRDIARQQLCFTVVSRFSPGIVCIKSGRTRLLAKEDQLQKWSEL